MSSKLSRPDSAWGRCVSLSSLSSRRPGSGEVWGDFTQLL
jgi:hypothetical protein